MNFTFDRFIIELVNSKLYNKLILLLYSIIPETDWSNKNMFSMLIYCSIILFVYMLRICNVSK